jgi:adenylate kinase
MIVALTGTPGTGKSTVSKLLRNKKYKVLGLNDIIKLENLTLGHDAARQTDEVDLERLNHYLTENLKPSYRNEKENKQGTISKKKSDNIVGNSIFLEGHIAHLLPLVDLVIILRCHPTELRKRLTNKAWVENKIHENLEAEAVDSILIESMERFNQDNVFEIDTTHLKPSEVMEGIINILKGNVKGFAAGRIDWSEEILKWY